MCNEIEIFEGHSISIVLTKYSVDEDDVETPEDFDGIHSAKIFSDPARTKEVMAFSEPDEIIKSGNELILFKKKSENNLKPNDYFLSLYNDLDSDNSFPEIQVNIKVTASRQQP